MIIGVSGKIGSGKDTVGKIIQYLTTNVKHSYNFEDFINPEVNYPISNPNDPLGRNLGSDWQIKKFADKLKDMVCLVLNCTREDLENIEFKNIDLGEEWVRYGRADGFFQGGSQGTIMNNASCTKEEYEAELRINWQTAYKFRHTPRSIMQMLGTEVGRFIHIDFWINALFADYKLSQYLYPNWIITDMRFPNELKAVKDRRGITIRVNRPNINKLVDSGINVQNTNEHPSETALDDAEFDHVIENDGTLDDLIVKVKELLILHSIL